VPPTFRQSVAHRLAYTGRRPGRSLTLRAVYEARPAAAATGKTRLSLCLYDRLLCFQLDRHPHTHARTCAYSFIIQPVSIQQFLPARRYASAGTSYGPVSVSK